jgi:hypothetical protein
MGGLILFSAGMGYIDSIAKVDSGRWSFLPGLIVAGVGLGFTWAPLFSIAMRDIEPRMAGVASGILETIQELGGVLAGAVVGAFLQNRLVAAMRDQAIQHADQLPPQFRDRFVDGFGNAAEGGLEVGTNGGGVGGAPDVPAEVAQQLQQLAEEVFKNGFVDAMHPTLVLPIVVVVLAALGCLAVERRKKAQPEETKRQSEEAAA